MPKLIDLVGKFADIKIAVLGDMVIDEYIHGTTQRISREAPVLIVREESREVRLGGAGNVAANIRAMKGVPLPVGLVGADEMGDRLQELMASRGISTEGILVDPSRSTTIKTRVLAGGCNTVRQQMLRIDRLNGQPAGASIRGELADRLKQAIPQAAALVVSDYGEGVVAAEQLEDVFGIIRDGRPPVFVDSRFKIDHFLGADTLTPNEPELAQASGMEMDTDDGLERAGRWMLRETRCQVLLVKRGRNGMAMFLPDRPTVLALSFGPTEVADVTGAGDTVLASYSLARSAGATPEEALVIANITGGIKVTKSGTAVVEAEELKRALEGVG